MPQQLVYERRVFRRPPANRVAEPDNGVDMATRQHATHSNCPHPLAVPRAVLDRLESTLNRVRA